MKVQVKDWIRKLTTSAICAAVLSSCAHGSTDFNQVGKQMSLLLQNAHFSRQEFTDDLSAKFLETYLKRMDPSKIFFTQQDVDLLTEKYGDQLDDYLLAGEAMEAAKPMYALYLKRVEERIQYALELLEKDEFKFDREAYYPRSRRKVAWPKDDEEMKAVWRDMVEEQLLSEILRRDVISQLAKEQDKADPAANEKPPREKLVLRYSRLLKNLTESSDDEDQAQALLSSVARSFDPHTDYMGARETESFKSAMDTSIIGIGALLGPEDDGSTIIKGITIGGPADKSGELKLNDRVVGVDTNSTGEMTDILFMKLEKVVELIRGKEGTTVTLKVEPVSNPGTVKLISIKRSRIQMKDELAKGEIIETKNDKGETLRLGYINLPTFYASMGNGDRRSSTDFQRLLERMVKENVKGLVVDLRNNGGGSLEEVRMMTGFFIGSGPVVQIRDTKGNVEVKSAYAKKPMFDGEIVVLTNKLSASASEILAAALQDYGRAVIVGDTSTFGKGSVQQPVEIARFLPYFSDGSRAGLLKVTTQKFYRVAGGSTQLKGVESDIVIPTMSAAFEIGESELDYAMPYDRIQPAKGFKKSSVIDQMLPTLKERSAKRVAADRDLQITSEEVAIIKKRIEDNRLSLNKKEREKENEEMQVRRKEVNKERKERFAQMAKEDAEKFKLYRLTLDDLADEKNLVLADPVKDNERFMKMAEDPTSELDDSPDYPSGLDPELREALNIVTDMIELKPQYAAEGAKK